MEEILFRHPVQGTKANARIHKIINHGKKAGSQLNSVKKSNGELTTSPQETLERLGEALIPGDGTEDRSTDFGTELSGAEIHDILAPHRLHRAVNNLDKAKAPGPDKIRNEMIIQAWDDIKTAVRRIFIISLTLGVTPSAWQDSTGVIIPKPFKLDYTEPRTFRIISLTSSLQTFMERVLLWHLQIDLKIPARLTKTQHGFKKGASTESAIHQLARRIENTMIHKHCALGVFLDIEGAFDNITFTAIREGLIDAGIPAGIAKWIYALTSCRTITISYCGESITRVATKGSAQGVVLSP